MRKRKAIEINPFLDKLFCKMNTGYSAHIPDITNEIKILEIYSEDEHIEKKLQRSFGGVDDIFVIQRNHFFKMRFFYSMLSNLYFTNKQENKIPIRFEKKHLKVNVAPVDMRRLDTSSYDVNKQEVYITGDETVDNHRIFIPGESVDKFGLEGYRNVVIVPTVLSVKANSKSPGPWR